MEVKIEKLDDFGRGICYIDNKVTFVPNTIPNDLVEIKITKEFKNYNEGKLINILIPSKKRIEPKLILVRGGLIDGMEGDFVFINFLETFEIKKEYEQLTLFNFEKIQTIRREMN